MKIDRTYLSFLGALVAVGCSSSSSNSTGDSGMHSGDAGTTHDSGTHVDSGTTTPVDAGHMADVVTTIDVTTTPDSTSPVDTGTTTKDAKEDTGPVKDGSGGGMDVKADAPVGAQHVLVTFGTTTQSELVSVGVTSKAVDGRMQFLGSGVTDTHNGTIPFLLEQVIDDVVKLDNSKPWTADDTFSVRLADEIADGASLQADPTSVAVASSTKAYVARYMRNNVAYFDEAVDGGGTTSTISLAGYLASGDSDGLVDMAAAVYVPSNQRVYVALANTDQTANTAAGGTFLCSGTKTTSVVAIDTATNTVVNLGGTGPMGAIELNYTNPMQMIYDSTNSRIVVVESGCWASATATTPQSGGVEAVAVSNNAVTPLLPLVASSFPSGFVYYPTSFAWISDTSAVIGFDATGLAVYQWNPTTMSLGANVPNAPDTFVSDGNGDLVGARLDSTTDGGTTKVEHIVSTNIASGASTILGTNVTSLTGTVYVSSVDVWPH